jgi:phosphinothricin acetyltransferase
MGAKLFAALLAEAQKMSVHALLSCITIPNERSVRLHEKAGFTQVALMREVGYKFARWLDVGYWELILEN